MSAAGPIPYEQFRSGLTFGQVRRMMWVGNPDPSTWRHKSRGVVLGFWRELKLDLYAEYLRRFAPANDNAGREPPSSRPGCVPLRKVIDHPRGRFEVTYWVKAAA